MSVIQTRLATRADRAALIGFIRDHWSASHVFVHAPEVFDWQYGQADGRLNLVLAKQDGVILGVLGFIPMGRFDPALGDEDCLLALWKAGQLDLVVPRWLTASDLAAEYAAVRGGDYRPPALPETGARHSRHPGKLDRCGRQQRA